MAGSDTIGPDMIAANPPNPETVAPAAAPHTPLPGTADPAPQPRGPDSREIRPGLFLRVSGGWTNPTLELSGPALDPVLRDRLETWLVTGH